MCWLRGEWPHDEAAPGVLLSDRCAATAQVEWTQELHERFVNAVETLGADKAVPSKILEHMGPIAVGLTRQNVASHLQKYRTRKRTQNDFCKAAAYCPPAAYQCWSPFNPPCAMIGAPLSPLAALAASRTNPSGVCECMSRRGCKCPCSAGLLDQLHRLPVGCPLPWCLLPWHLHLSQQCAFQCQRS